jgi:hypothetical protein
MDSIKVAGIILCFLIFISSCSVIVKGLVTQFPHPHHDLKSTDENFIGTGIGMTINGTPGFDTGTGIVIPFDGSSQTFGTGEF